ncbi:MAG TPA: LPS export ABC transporter permease LptF [Paracoccaceae bacterium]|nr:LPS export ABC transporter permease LptF [Paracoccaceae bacterium]
MRRLDSYIFRQILGPFLFFVLVFTGVIWLTQSLRVVETVVNNGQSALVFLEFAALLLPTVLSIVLPISLFAAVLYTINRLFGDSEIVVMMAAGLSGTAILRAVTAFGLAVMLVVYLLTLWLMPLAQREMRARIADIRGDVAAAFMREGAFLTPVDGVTVYLRETGPSGELLGVFVQDERDPEREVTYSARRAILVRDGAGTRLLMFEGMVQSMGGPGATDLSVLRFDQLAYDLTSLSEAGAERARKPSEMFVPELLTITADEAAARSLGEFRAEAHEALSAPLYTLTLPLLAVAFVIGAGFRRQGFAGRIVLAAGAGLGIRVAGLAAKSVVTGAAPLWPLMYVPPLLGILVGLWILSGLRLPRRRTGAA